MTHHDAPDDAQARHVFTESLGDLTMVPSRDQLDRMLERRRIFENRMSLFSADLECEHGTCPGDGKPQAGCPGYAACTGQAVPIRRPAVVAAVAAPVAAAALAAPVATHALPKPRRRPRGQAKVTPRKHVGADGLQHFTCSVCGEDWTRPAQAGAPPKTCPQHRPQDHRATRELVA